MSTRGAAPPSFAVAALALTIIGPAASSSCDDVVQWKGVVYSAARTPEHPVPFAEELGKGESPCLEDQGPACHRHQVPQVSVFHLRGVDSSVAVGVREGKTPVYYLGPGYFPALSDHPLHDAIFKGRADRPDERAGWECGPPIELSGTVDRTPRCGTVLAVRFAGDRVRRQYGYTGVFVDAGTEIDGFRRNGIPYIESGDKLRASVWECTASGERYKVVADRIRPEPQSV
jgi:hypothetical protein